MRYINKLNKKKTEINYYRTEVYLLKPFLKVQTVGVCVLKRKKGGKKIRSKIKRIGWIRRQYISRTK